MVFCSLLIAKAKTEFPDAGQLLVLHLCIIRKSLAFSLKVKALALQEKGLGLADQDLVGCLWPCKFWL